MSVHSVLAPSETLLGLQRESPFAAWEERAPRRKEEEDKKDTTESRARGPQGDRAPCELQGQEEKDELGFAAQAGFLESRDARVGIVLLKRRRRAPMDTTAVRGM